MITLHRALTNIWLTGTPGGAVRVRVHSYYRGRPTEHVLLAGGPMLEVPETEVVTVVFPAQPAALEAAQQEARDRARRLLESKLNRADTFVTEYVGAWENGSVKT